MDTPGISPQTTTRLPRLVRWMLRHSLRTNVREEALLAFEDEFNERIGKVGSEAEARRWAMRTAWDCFHEEWRPMIEISTIALAILSAILALVALL